MSKTTAITTTGNPAKALTIGLFGFGVVGKGLYDVLSNTPKLNASIKKICIKSLEKKRTIASHHFTSNPEELLEDDAINVIVELIDDSDAAFEIVKQALQRGKSVVSANKKMIAANCGELMFLQKIHPGSFLYEASCCASIPILRNLEEYYDNDLLNSVKGIINGSTNYILSKMAEDKLSFNEALLQAQQLGFAESQPSLDIDGFDAVNKLAILTLHAFGVLNKPADFIFNGIAAINSHDSKYAAEKKLQIKLVAHALRIEAGHLAAFVLPQFVEPDDDLYSVKNEFNGLVTESSFADRQFFKGKGAGGLPTAAAVLSDIAALRYGYKYEYKKLSTESGLSLSNDFYLRVYVGTTHMTNIRAADFEWIEETRTSLHYNSLIGVIHAKKLAASDWWKKDSISLILYPDPVVLDVPERHIKKRSLQLAGVN